MRYLTRFPRGISVFAIAVLGTRQCPPLLLIFESRDTTLKTKTTFSNLNRS